MAEISKITDITGTTYDIKDVTARSAADGKVSKAGDTMTGSLTLAANAGLITNRDAGWSMNQYGNLTHRRTNSSDTWDIVGSGGSLFKVVYDTGALTAGSVTSTGSATIANSIILKGNSSPQFYFRNNSNAEIGSIWANGSGKIFFRLRPSAGSSYVTDIVLPDAKTNGNENVTLVSNRNFSLSGTTLTITV